MTRSILLDANLLIGAFDSEDGHEAHERARNLLRELLQDPDVKLAITPLIRYEVLRGARRVSLDSLDHVLNGFQEFEIRGQDARRAAELFRLAKDRNVELSRRKFDVFHCVCAEINNLEIASQDGDIPVIQNLIQDSYA